MPTHAEKYSWNAIADLLSVFGFCLIFLILQPRPFSHLYGLWHHTLIYWWDILVPALFPALSIALFLSSRTYEHLPRFSTVLLAISSLPVVPLVIVSSKPSASPKQIALAAIWGNLYNPFIFPHTIPIVSLDICSLIIAFLLEMMRFPEPVPSQSRPPSSATSSGDGHHPTEQSMNLTTTIGGFLALIHSLRTSLTPLIVLLDPILSSAFASYGLLVIPILLMNGLAFLLWGIILTKRRWTTLVTIRIVQVALGSFLWLFLWLFLPQFRTIGF
ncbi:hypothetical protein SAMN00768000_3377 [Sulfobacillus thermosulfidooxidans DSM 9293]|uniref:Uncharacterized protein n=1 Tax=Sulfobacillus thermosulfidooxidans (strain DSM 9293 / VKM B-1269 / AT-1) TaxID=929705 RepID=A0A1W1WN15_SULTA|nr:hypothetical protein [Sulfobacillus thermosulfidooxidans]SMC07420.1 hypothetical protein SAMN00768000_3377 [Sulfobacillus thermosulfidooxidans DSM 9293]